MHKTDSDFWNSLTEEQRKDMMLQTQSAAYQEWMEEGDWDECRNAQSAWQEAQLQTEFNSSENWGDSLSPLVVRPTLK